MFSFVAILTNKELLEDLNANIDKLLPKLMEINSNSTKLPTITKRLKEFYLNGSSTIKESNGQGFLNVSNRFFFLLKRLQFERRKTGRMKKQLVETHFSDVQWSQFLLSIVQNCRKLHKICQHHQESRPFVQIRVQRVAILFESIHWHGQRFRSRPYRWPDLSLQNISFVPRVCSRIRLGEAGSVAGQHLCAVCQAWVCWICLQLFYWQNTYLTLLVFAAADRCYGMRCTNARNSIAVTFATTKNSATLTAMWKIPSLKYEPATTSTWLWFASGMKCCTCNVALITGSYRRVIRIFTRTMDAWITSWCDPCTLVFTVFYAPTWFKYYTNHFNLAPLNMGSMWASCRREALFSSLDLG